MACFHGPDIAVFWAASIIPFATGHVDLVLSAVTQQLVVTPQSQNLIADIKAIPVKQYSGSQSANNRRLEQFLPAARVPLLPPFTAPGTPAERVAAFIRHLRKFFDVATQAGPLNALAANAIPTLGIASNDPINTFVGFYNANPTPPFAFGSPVNQAFFDQAIQDVFPNDAEPQAWLVQTLHAIDELFRMTTGIDPTLQFSLMEALYARGFDSMINVQALSASEFEQATHRHGGLSIREPNLRRRRRYWRASETGTRQVQASESRRIPCELHPALAPVVARSGGVSARIAESLSELHLRSPHSARPSYPRTLVAGRRGPLGLLHATAANLHTPVPAD